MRKSALVCFQFHGQAATGNEVNILLTIIILYTGIPGLLQTHVTCLKTI